MTTALYLAICKRRKVLLIGFVIVVMPLNARQYDSGMSSLSLLLLFVIVALRCLLSCSYLASCPVLVTYLCFGCWLLAALALAGAVFVLFSLFTSQM
jgi:hypothetical protein